MTDAVDVSKLVHDLRNPLNSIAMTAELAKLQLLRGEPAAAVAENLDAIVRLCRECGVRLESFSSARAGRPRDEDSGRAR